MQESVHSTQNKQTCTWGFIFFFRSFILLDWIIEVAEMKSFSTKTLHLAISLVQRYMVARKLKRSRLQLLGVTALLLAAR